MSDEYEDEEMYDDEQDYEEDDYSEEDEDFEEDDSSNEYVDELQNFAGIDSKSSKEDLIKGLMENRR